ncbi:hypothetical protein FJ976_28260 [Mesorhizobium sp. B1-1-9]|nr:hypothetical protein FJ976_28260 [Mesorhizobium sp. B1-1-9]TPN44155.1 hypothetical protein FJ978_29595 [Mesorhizobium sp. B1-1-7]
MRGVPAWQRRRSVTHPSTVSALRVDPPSPTRGEGRAAALSQERLRLNNTISPWPSKLIQAPPCPDTSPS